jgi:hypothetical protein
MPDISIELPLGDVTPLLAHLDGAVFANLRPTVDDDGVPPRSSLGNLFGNRGPTVPLATWTPGEIGLQHAAGQRAAPLLKDKGIGAPDEWYVVSDNPKRGLVLRTYDTPIADTLTWLVQAGTLLCPVPITGPWLATVRTR